MPRWLLREVALADATPNGAAGEGAFRPAWMAGHGGQLPQRGHQQLISWWSFSRLEPQSSAISPSWSKQGRPGKWVIPKGGW